MVSAGIVIHNVTPRGRAALAGPGPVGPPVLRLVPASIVGPAILRLDLACIVGPAILRLGLVFVAGPRRVAGRQPL
jgi:hypothetical protein